MERHLEDRLGRLLCGEHRAVGPVWTRGCRNPDSASGFLPRAIGGLNSLMAVIAPAIGAPLLAMVSHLPQGDWRIGAPFYFCAVLQAMALVLAISHFRRERQALS